MPLLLALYPRYVGPVALLDEQKQRRDFAFWMSAPGVYGNVLVLIDESGDPGFRTARGSTSHFVMAMVIFNDLKEAENTSLKINDLKDQLRVRPEFKFTKSANPVRDSFFNEIRGFRFSVRAIVVDKARVQSPHLRMVTDSFYNFFLQLLLKHDGGSTQGASIKLDGSGNAKFRKQMATYLRRQLRDGQIAKFKFVDSKRDNLIQLADMCAGAILRAYRDDARRETAWLDILRRAKRIEDVWQFR